MQGPTGRVRRAQAPGVSRPVSLSPQTSNPLEVTGRASAVHTLLQKAPGVGGSYVHPSLLPRGMSQPARPLVERHT